MAGELDNLYLLFQSLSLVDNMPDDISADDMKKAIGAFLIHCPVYRYYGDRFPLADKEASAVKHIFKNITNKYTEKS